MIVFYNYLAFRKCIGWWGFLWKRQRKGVISKHCQSTYHDTLKNEVYIHVSQCLSSVFTFADCFWDSVYWHGTVSSRLTLKEQGIHSRFPVFILGVYFHCRLLFEIRCIGRVLLVLGSRLKNDTVKFHCMLLVATKMQAVTITIIRCNCRMETLLVRSWIKLSIRRIERIGRIDKLARTARGHCYSWDAIFGWRTQDVRSSIIFSIRRIEQIETLLVGS